MVVWRGKDAIFEIRPDRYKITGTGTFIEWFGDFKNGCAIVHGGKKILDLREGIVYNVIRVEEEFKSDNEDKHLAIVVYVDTKKDIEYGMVLEIQKRRLNKLGRCKDKATELWDLAEQGGSSELQELALQFIDFIDDLIDDVRGS